MGVDDIADRRSELPAPYAVVPVLQTGPESTRACEILQSLSRQPRLVDESFVRPRGEPFLWEPSVAAQQLVSIAEPGTVLDLGCGCGRDSIYLALHGWTVTAVDRVADLIEDGKRIAGRIRRPIEIDWVHANAQQWQPESKFDAVLLVYTYEPALTKRCEQWSGMDGILVIQTFSQKHFECFGRPGKTKCKSEEELIATLPGHDVLDSGEVWSSDRHSSFGLFRRALTL